MIKKIIAFFSDVHANLPALKAVLTDIDNVCGGEIFCLGDLVGYGPWPNETVELIRERNIPTIMGNYDEGVGNDRDDCGCAYPDPEEAELGQKSLRWTQQQIKSDNREFLASLPENRELKAAGWQFKLVHGSPRRINEYLYLDRPASSLDRFFAEEYMDVLVCGHTHLPYIRYLNEGIVINDGSAGKPKSFQNSAGKYSPAVSYVLARIGENELSLEIRTVRYDYEKTAKAIENSALPDHFAGILRGEK